MKTLKLIFKPIELLILIIIWGFGYIFGKIIIGIDVMKNTNINKQIIKILEYYN